MLYYRPSICYHASLPIYFKCVIERQSKLANEGRYH